MERKTEEKIEEKQAERKRPYEKPSLSSEKIFEATVLACGKQPSQGGFCRGRPGKDS